MLALAPTPSAKPMLPLPKKTEHEPPAVHLLTTRAPLLDTYAFPAASKPTPVGHVKPESAVALAAYGGV
jgi:hypothetical protein